MSSSSREPNDASAPQHAGPSEPPTYAAFSPATLGHPSIAAQRSTILVHQKSPLLVATPPQITRALAYSYPFIVSLNKVAGLLSWTTGDPWESFLLVAAFWAVTLYGDITIRWTGPIVLVSGLILGMYSRRYSVLSSTGWTGEKGGKGHKRGASASDPSTRHHKSLDDILDELKLFTSRCNILLDPALRLTDFLSTQRTATSATTRPALTALFIRILLVSPIWFALTLPPFYFITTKRVILTIGTISMSWHCRPARVSRTILWRSRTVRRACAAITGLDFAGSMQDGDTPPELPPRKSKNANEIAASLAAKRKPAGIRFTFTLYENQRRWLGIGWTSSMLAYERASWTDEELNSSPSKDQFELPEVEGGHARWRWVEEKWHVEGMEDDEKDDGEKGWVYYDNKWRNGRRDKDGWGRYTRRRKWCRDAELIEVTPSTEITPSPTPKIGPSGQEKEAQSENEVESKSPDSPPPEYRSTAPEDTVSLNSANSTKRRRWFRRSSGATMSDRSAAAGSGSGRSVGRAREDEDEDVHSPLHHQESQHDWGFGDDAKMGLG